MIAFIEKWLLVHFLCFFFFFFNESCANSNKGLLPESLLRLPQRPWQYCLILVWLRRFMNRTFSIYPTSKFNDWLVNCFEMWINKIWVREMYVPLHEYGCETKSVHYEDIAAHHACLSFRTIILNIYDDEVLDGYEHASSEMEGPFGTQLSKITSTLLSICLTTWCVAGL